MAAPVPTTQSTTVQNEHLEELQKASLVRGEVNKLKLFAATKLLAHKALNETPFQTLTWLTWTFFVLMVLFNFVCGNF
jgi:hypothetical protein